MSFNNIKQQFGFTLIEMIVSLALFSVVITISVGALLVLIASNEQLQNEQSVMTNLAFALDSMTREIRTGTYYYCEGLTNDNNNLFEKSSDDLDNSSVIPSLGAQDCVDGRKHAFSVNGYKYHGVAFMEGGDSITGVGKGRILYFFDEDEGKIFRKVGDKAQSIVSSGIYIQNAEFFVTGSKALSDGNPNAEDQPTVTVYIEAKDREDATKVYKIQTTVTQRILDI